MLCVVCCVLCVMCCVLCVVCCVETLKECENLKVCVFSPSVKATFGSDDSGTAIGRACHLEGKSKSVKKIIVEEKPNRGGFTGK